ncbi:MAG: hypothetical protein J6M92_05845 [Oribacterium sp.]|nr:hypothetical protein [Oribacterium sp.]
MGTRTNHYLLTKPAQSDFYNVADFNENAEIIDAALYDNAESIAAEVQRAQEAEQQTNQALSGLLNKIALNNAGAHNSIFRGKNLGTSVTAAQWAAIQAGTFDDMYIGDYWVINGITYRIAAFDYYYLTGDTAFTDHHVVIVPDESMYSYVMNDSNVTTGAYYGSKMKTSGLSAALTTVIAAFGSSHVLEHRQYFANAVSNGRHSAGAWYSTKIDLMTEENVYGGKVFEAVSDGSTVPANYTIDKSQFPLFALAPWMISFKRYWYWLRNVVSASSFALVDSDGGADYSDASNSNGVRPAFCIG